MTAFLVAGFSLFAAALFEVDSIPLADEHSRIILAPVDQDKTVDLVVLEGRTLTAYSGVSVTVTALVTLPPEASAFDIADVNDDGQTEVVVVCGQRIMSCALVPGRTELVELFSLDTLLDDTGKGSGSKREPYPHVLVIRREGRNLLALPCADGLELRTREGRLDARYALAAENTPPSSGAQSFRSASVHPPQAGGTGALEISVHRFNEYHPDLPEQAIPIEGSDRTSGPALAGVEVVDRAGGRDLRWSWFPLRTHGGGTARVLYAPAPPDGRNTLLMVEPARREKLETDAVKAGSGRQYPGVLIEPDTDSGNSALPDFNGDGFADVLLWTSPEAGTSIDSLTRTMTGGTWPVRILAHLYSPETGRYEPQPVGRLDIRVPVTWFLTLEGNSPVHHLLLRDFDGDGRTDFACSTDRNQYSVWLCRGGFDPEPDFTYRFPEPLTGIEFCTDLDGRGHCSIGLRSAKALYLLHPHSAELR